ncbi:PglL family O-oligosaccharyltransferase [Hydrogenophaga aquatica]
MSIHAGVRGFAGATIYSIFPILMLLILYASMPAVIEWMGWFPVQEARSMVADGARARLWSMVVEAISQSPWIGYGFGAVANIHLRFSPEYGDFSFMIARHAHNSILDMLVVFGIPIGILIVAPVCYLLMRAWSLCGRVDEKFLWLMAASMVVHGMLEFPLHYGFFLWLLFLIFGVLVGRKVYVIDFSYSGVYAIGYLAIFGFFSFSIWSSYVQMERIFTLHRQQGPDVVNRLLVEQDFPLRKSLFVEPYERLQWVTTPLDEIYYLSDGRLRDLERYASYYPLPALVFRMALAQAARGNAEQASWWAERMCRMFDPSVCASAAEEWKRFGTENPNWLALPWDKWLSANAVVQ